MSVYDGDGFFRMIFRFHSAIFEILCVSQRPLRLCGEKNSIEMRRPWGGWFPALRPALFRVE
jgi:hypothetical protein